MVKHMKKAPTAAGTAISATMPKHENSDIISGIDLAVKDYEESASRNVCPEWEKEYHSITLMNKQWLILFSAIRASISHCEDTARDLTWLSIKKGSASAPVDQETFKQARAFRERAKALREILRLII